MPTIQYAKHTEILKLIDLSIEKKQNFVYQVKEQLQSKEQLEIFTDASIDRDLNLASFAIYIPNIVAKAFNPIGKPSTTSYELQAILRISRTDPSGQKDSHILRLIICYKYF